MTKARLKLVSKFVATCILIAWLLSELDVERLVKSITRVDALYLTGGILLSATFALTRVWKWQVLTRENPSSLLRGASCEKHDASYVMHDASFLHDA